MRSVAVMVVPFLPSAAAEQQKKKTKRRQKTGYGGSQKQRISIPIPFLLLQGSGAVHTSD
jgi:hypothetical protein